MHICRIERNITTPPLASFIDSGVFNIKDIVALPSKVFVHFDVSLTGVNLGFGFAQPACVCVFETETVGYKQKQSRSYSKPSTGSIPAMMVVTSDQSRL